MDKRESEFVEDQVKSFRAMLTQIIEADLDVAVNWDASGMIHEVESQDGWPTFDSNWLNGPMAIFINASVKPVLVTSSPVHTSSASAASTDAAK